MSTLVTTGNSSLVDPQAQRLVDFLRDVGLPHDNIMADPSERAIIASNLPAYLQSLPAEVKRDARYLSKFVIGAGSGLFDYALNAIWNEVVIDLRKKAALYGLDIFFDAAVGGNKTREFYKTEDDLAALKDAVLLDTCRKLELISDTTYKKLKHILDMRNDIGISHPTNYTINAFELLGWLQTCVQDVLNDRPTEAALKVQAFISNLKGYTSLLDAPTLQTLKRRFAELPSHLCGNLLRTVFGIYVAPDTDQAVRRNIATLAPDLWRKCLDEPRYKLGIVLEGYNSNLYKDKYVLGEQFFRSWAEMRIALVMSVLSSSIRSLLSCSISTMDGIISTTKRRWRRIYGPTCRTKMPFSTTLLRVFLRRSCYAGLGGVSVTMKASPPAGNATTMPFWLSVATNTLRISWLPSLVTKSSGS